MSHVGFAGHDLARTRRRALPALAATLTMVVAALGVATFQPPAEAQQAQLQQVDSFGSNPNNLNMYIYVPAQLQDPVPLVVDMHGCGGTAQFEFSISGMRTQADEHGFIVVYPEKAGQCWDQGPDDGIISMVDHVKANYNVDDSKVVAAGISAGGYMTSQMVGGYADVFAGGSVWAGTPFDCSLYLCAIGLDGRTAQQWGDAVRQANPGFSGPWPRMQIWHGNQDGIVQFSNAQESVEQWTNVHGISQTPSSTEPQAGMPNNVVKRSYDSGGQTVVEFFEFDAGHTTHANAAAETVRFFGLDGSPTTPPTSGPGGTDTTVAPPPCFTATNSQHRDAGRAEGFLFLSAVGSGDSLGLWFSTTSLQESPRDSGSWRSVPGC